MIPYLGDFVEDDVVYLMFNTFSSDDPSASVTITNFINTDVHIHKDDGLTQRNNAAGITVSVNFDGITGSHLIKIDTSDNTVAGFWVIGHDYFVRIEGTTIDGATINAVVGHFSIQNRFMRGTESAYTGTPPTVTQIRQEMDANSTKMAPSQTLADYKADVSNLDVAVSTRNATTPPTTAQIKTALEQAGSSLAQILADTNEMELDLKNGGRIDLILDIIAADTTTNIPGLILKYTQLLARSDAAITTDNATELTAINADGGSGAGDFSNQDDGIEAIRDRGDAAWTTGSVTGLSPLATGTAQDGAAGSIMLAAGASAKNDLYKGARILITGGTGTEQSRIITAYDGTTKVASVAPNWVTTPNATSTYEIQAADSNVGAIQNDGQGATDLKDFVSGGLLQKVKGIVETILATVSS